MGQPAGYWLTRTPSKPRSTSAAGRPASHFFFGPPTELSRVNTHSDYRIGSAAHQPWQYNNGNGMLLALKTPILRPKIEGAEQNELFPPPHRSSHLQSI